MSAAVLRSGRRWLAPEVVQTSGMDCGPAALKCLLEGHRIAVSYGRLREACQTDVDGTSIDTIEVVANQLGVRAEQVMIPADHLFLQQTHSLPALVVVRQPDGSPHFVVVWRMAGRWLQVMDPAAGRRWTTVDRFAQELLRHALRVPAGEWRQWAGGAEFLEPLRRRIASLGLPDAEASGALAEALADRGWFGLGALDASVRLVQSLVAAGGLRRGGAAGRLAVTLFRRTRESPGDIHALVPAAYWSVTPDATNTDARREMLVLHGAVLLRVGGRRMGAAEGPADLPPLSSELAAALAEGRERPLRAVVGMLREDGLLGPAALAGALAIAVGALLLEALLLRGMFDIPTVLATPAQRLGAVLAVVVFAVSMLPVRIPILTETLRHGRHLETRLRVALLAKLPRLNDRYFQSRPVSDMADRGHAVHLARLVPGLGLHFVQITLEIALTLAGIVLVAPDSAGGAALVALAAIGLPLLVQPLLNERDLRVHSHAAALHGFNLDALLGLLPVRAHRAERSLRRMHEGLLVEWARSTRGWIRTALMADAAQSLVCLGLAGALLVDHFLAAGAVSGSDLLLVYWTLKLPAAGTQFAGLAQQYPTQRSALLRLVEPLQAPDDIAGAEAAAADPAATVEAPEKPVRIGFDRLGVVVGGHRILDEVTLSVQPGEHVAIVGVSGAGKSSLLGVLLGWHRPAAGALSIDGVPAEPGAVVALRRRTAWVDPAVQIWNRSLLDNLAYACADDAVAGIGEVLRAADLRGVVRKLPDGLQTLLGEGGGRLSGGEGQRMRLGRALLMPAPRLVLLDEPFRGLDRDQRHRLLAEARAWWRTATLLCVTHDVGETRSFDRVVVVEDGRVVEDGAPARLAAGPTRYRALLDAEARVTRSLWASGHWRRIEVRAGRVREAGDGGDA